MVEKKKKAKRGEREISSGSGEIKNIAERQAHLEKDIKNLKEELKIKEKEADEYLDTLKRLKAEFENYKKRIIKEQTRVVELAAESVVAKLLPLIDNLERALGAAKKTHDVKTLIKGVEMVYSQLKEILFQEGVEVINPCGERFNPEKHEAVIRVESEKHEEDTVVEVLQKGYTLKGKLIRPALVKVSYRSQVKPAFESESRGDH